MKRPWSPPTGPAPASNSAGTIRLNPSVVAAKIEGSSNASTTTRTVQSGQAHSSHSTYTVRGSTCAPSGTIETSSPTSSTLEPKALSRWFMRNQAGLSFNLIALLFLTYSCIPKSRGFTSQFFTLSHYNPRTGNYAVGQSDLCFIIFWVVLLTGLRAAFLDHVLGPLARHWNIPNKRDVVRFAEQTWLILYYAVFYSLGVYIYCHSTYFLDMKELWTDYPTRELSGIVKFYILGQLSFWVQQILVIYIEERRKDHMQMLSHHVVTIGLIATCYAYHFTRVGNLILITMDIVDILFPLAKCLKYFDFTTLCNITFGLFVVTWFVTRHIIFVIILYCMWRDMPIVIPEGCFHGPQDNLTGPYDMPERGWSQVLEPFRNPSGTVCYSDTVRWTYLAALGFLQVLTIFWFFMIVRVAVRVMQGVSADDPRSDSEDGDEEELEDEKPAAEPVRTIKQETKATS